MRILHMPAAWTPIDEELTPVLERLLGILDGWRGTPYASGQRRRGSGADCVGFVCGALDDLDGRARASDPRIPPDTALHDPRKSVSAVRGLLETYLPWERVESGLLQPGDVLVVGPRGAGPSHAMLVGPVRNTVWHCTAGAGVHQAGWALGTGYERLHAAYRLGDRERWLR